MNEVEKMYSNAGVEKYYCSFESSDGNVYNWELNEDGNEKYNMCFIGKPKIKQRLFTAEKQLELIKWLINEVDYITMWHFNNSKKPYDFDLGSHNSGGETFEDALAQMINNLWQSLTDAEKQQIKEVLE